MHLLVGQNGAIQFLIVQPHSQTAQGWECSKGAGPPVEATLFARPIGRDGVALGLATPRVLKEPSSGITFIGENLIHRFTDWMAECLRM